MSASAMTVPMPPAFDDDVLATEEVSQARLVWRRFRRHRLGLLGITVIGLIALACILAPWIAPYTFDKPDTSNIMGTPSASHWLGTDELGRDVLSRLLYAGRISLLVSLVATLLSIMIGVLVGSIAAYFGGALDTVLMR
ncbi:MAG: ABC transporter permease, partial [Proteobacteria bacterium]|nr:ABC transporter permease [Pseudomonadota bacterium]